MMIDIENLLSLVDEALKRPTMFQHILNGLNSKGRSADAFLASHKRFPR